MKHSIITTMIIEIITCFFLITATASTPPHGFTIDLIHRRSNSSSSSRPSDTELGSPYANTVFDHSVYLMKLQIGTPPIEFEVILDTGSDLIWTQCLPCLHCYEQGTPKFDPSKSSTYRDNIGCGSPDHTCPYEVIYGDQSYSKGTYATEKVTIQSTSGNPFVMPETTIGCGHNNSMTGGMSPPGSVGLNWGSLSLNSQMGDTIQGLFSYCFSGNGTSKINFGGNAIVSGDRTVATNMFRKEKRDFYYLNLDAISVGENRVETLGTSFYAQDGNIFIDSGTTYTYLPGSYCNQVMDAIENVVKADRAPFSGDIRCYNSDTIDIFPVITMHFSGDADLVLDKYNIYMDTGAEHRAFCVMIMCVDPTKDAIFGNRAQNNFLVGYDTYSELVSFKPTNCSALWS